MSPDEFEEYKAAIGFWRDLHGDISPLINSDQIITFYRENYGATRQSNEV
jgi:hypothetical protein